VAHGQAGCCTTPLEAPCRRGLNSASNGPRRSLGSVPSHVARQVPMPWCTPSSQPMRHIGAGGGVRCRRRRESRGGCGRRLGRGLERLVGEERRVEPSRGGVVAVRLEVDLRGPQWRGKRPPGFTAAEGYVSTDSKGSGNMAISRRATDGLHRSARLGR
jgi:hypothetical protein